MPAAEFALCGSSPFAAGEAGGAEEPGSSDSSHKGATDVVATDGHASQDDARLDAIYVAHFHFVWRTLRRMGVPPSCLDDAVQDVFLVAHRKLAEFEGRSSLKTWLCAIALRVARDYRRSVRRRGPQISLDEMTASCSRPTPVEGAERIEAARVLHRFLDSIDPSKREVFVLSELEGMTAPEISRATGTRVNTVYARLRKARQLFVETVERERSKDQRGGDER